MLRKLMVVIPVVLAVSACGGGSSGGGGSTPTTATGQFKDGNVAGVSYVSGSQSGTTDTHGNFTYEIGETVTFSIGGVTIGTSEGKAVVTPVDFVPNGNSTSPEVLNIARFLMLLDVDGNASNGINVSSEVSAAADNWPSVDFAEDVSELLAEFVSQLNSIVDESHSLPDAGEAQAHMEATLRCAYAGAYIGRYTGDDAGIFGILVDASSGVVQGIGHSAYDDVGENFGLIGTTPFSYDQDAGFITGDSTTGATFSGNFTSVNSVQGQWENTNVNPQENGAFLGSRIGGQMDAKYRYTGSYDGDDSGFFTFDVDYAGAVSGIAYSIADDTSLTLSGTASGGHLTATVSDGSEITGTLNLATGELNGTWVNTTENVNYSGAFSGSGCTLNPTGTRIWGN